jgi:hypothetical protein
MHAYTLTFEPRHRKTCSHFGRGSCVDVLDQGMHLWFLYACVCVHACMHACILSVEVVLMYLITVCIHVLVCMLVCLYACIYASILDVELVLMSLSRYECTHMHACMYRSTLSHDMNVCTGCFINVCKYIVSCMYACAYHACMYVCIMHVCMFVFAYM